MCFNTAANMFFSKDWAAVRNVSSCPTESLDALRQGLRDIHQPESIAARLLEEDTDVLTLYNAILDAQGDLRIVFRWVGVDDDLVGCLMLNGSAPFLARDRMLLKPSPGATAFDVLERAADSGFNIHALTAALMNGDLIDVQYGTPTDAQVKALGIVLCDHQNVILQFMVARVFFPEGHCSSERPEILRMYVTKAVAQVSALSIGTGQAKSAAVENAERDILLRDI